MHSIETYILNGGEIKIYEGHETVFKEDGTNNSGGILIIVKDII